jgi:thioredoxin-like negative regulator of GroEL
LQNINPTELQEKIESGRPIFLKLWKKGCGACKLSVPAIERLEAAHGETVSFVQILADDHPDILEITESEVLPAFYVFKDKSMVGSQVGFKGIKGLESLISMIH